MTFNVFFDKSMNMNCHVFAAVFLSWVLKLQKIFAKLNFLLFLFEKKQKIKITLLVITNIGFPHKLAAARPVKPYLTIFASTTFLVFQMDTFCRKCFMKQTKLFCIVYVTGVLTRDYVWQSFFLYGAVVSIVTSWPSYK